MSGSGKRRALGRGLGALIPSGGDEHEERRGPRDFFRAAIEDLHPSPDQPRKQFDEARLDELAASIRAEGVLQPLLVRERPAAQGGGFYLIAGERRWRAAQRAGLKEVPVIVREATPGKAFEMALVENLQRDDLNPIEEAEAYRHLSDDYGCTQEQIAERVGKDRATVANALRLLKLPPSVRAMVQEGVLSMGHARALLGLDDAEQIEATARKVRAAALSVRATEDLVRRLRKPPAKPAAPKPASTRDLEQRLTRNLGARVAIQDRGKDRGGRIVISYGDLDDLDRLLDRLLGTAQP
jgi:ParB family transcriptional regulator, chromosome partitioning protein